MIAITRRDQQYLALWSDYKHKNAIKAIAPYPAVRWDPEIRCWLVDDRMIDAVIYYLGEYLEPLSVNLVMSLPVVQMTPRKARNRGYKPGKTELRAAMAAGVILHAENPFEVLHESD